MAVEKLLVIRFSAMGDVAMTVPVIASLARQYPSLQITVLSQPFAKAFYQDLAPNVRFYGSDIKREYCGLDGLARLYRQLAKEGFTAVADLHNTLRAKYLRLRFMLNGHPTAHVNKHRSLRKQLLRSEGGEKPQLPSSFQNYADVLAQLGYPVTLSFQSLIPEGGADLNLLSAPIEAKGDDEMWIGIAPFAAHPNKVYPQEKMHQVVRLLLERAPRCRLFFFGFGAKEFAVIDQQMDGNARCLNASAKLKGLQEEMLLMSHLDAMLTMDSANMHIASLAATRVVSIWGATHPLAGFYGWGQQRKDAVCLNLPCQPCSIYGNKPCKYADLRCMNISPEAIVNRILNQA